MPFCKFFHAMTICLNACLFNTVTSISKENRYNNEEDAMSLIHQDMLIPQPIAEYFSMINTTALGDIVYVNLPDCCLPQLSIPDVGDLPRIPPRNFGSVTPDSYNAYECYVSPYITRRHIEAYRDTELIYDPLPIEHLPQDATPNKNLLGYFFPVTITDDERQKMYHFPEEDNMTGRLTCTELVPRLMEDVNVTLSTFKQWYKIIPYHNILRKSVRYNFIYNRLHEHQDIDVNHEVLETESTLYSPYFFDETAATKAAIFSLRRERTNNARGLCFTIGDGLDPVGWAATINYNFTMSGRFAPLFGVNCSQLWYATHTADMLISRLDIIDNFIDASKVI
ncbi:uncharacterized protein LOC116852862 [Odontomachus brunneus]|uniref:uncharacterized protein LOC116852862 n=1 Tax=Odontomachus brunneus TaxID=486640 RepID=UPI0013F19542|nr:uncharacterized protein LOC116852862 [Odontomachus brunneus]